MLYVGNDLVDMKDPANVGKSRDLRYLKKILTSAEIEFVAGAVNQDRALWSFWACKETAYKVIVKSCVNPAFQPRCWEVVQDKPQSDFTEGKVVLPGKEAVFVRLLFSDNYVHCIGCNDLTLLDKIIWGVDVAGPAEADGVISPSASARRYLIRKLSEYYHLDLPDIEIRRDNNNGKLSPPCVYYRNDKYPIDISLSHDSRFVACCFC